MKRKIIIILAFALLLSVLGGCTACSGKKKTVGKITETAGSGESPSNWKPETADVRAELDTTYLAKYEGTQAFAEVNPTGTVYYISSRNGSNTGDGKSPEKAWKYCSKLDSVSLKSGDAVLFECGSVFREKISLKSGVTYSCYGEGAKPIFYGSIDASKASKWQEVSGKKGLYQYTDTINAHSDDIGSICFDNGAAWGIKMLKLRDSNKTLKLMNVSNGLETFSEIPSYSFSSGTDLSTYDLTYYHDASGRLYLYSAKGNPGTRFKSIELGEHKMIFSGSNVKDVTVANIDFRGGTFAIRTTVCENLTVLNCSFFFIGGSVQSDFGEWRNYDTRLGNAIENWNGCNGMRIENCYFNQVYDTAMTTQSNSQVNMKNVVYRNNLVENVWFGIELWAGDANGGCQFENVDVSGNYFTGIGEGFTTQRPDKFEYGAGIEGFIKISRGPYTVSNASVTDNIIDGSIGRMAQCNQPKTDQNDNGFLFDRNTYVSQIGATFLTISSAFPKYEGTNTTNKKYEYKVIKELVAHGFETNGKFYYAVAAGDPNGAGMIQNFTIRTETSPSYSYTAKNGTVIPFRLYLPDGYTESGNYPLITYLNVENASGTDNLAQVTASNLLMAEIALSGKAVLLVPQCPSGTWTGLPVNNGNYSIGSVGETAVMQAIADLIGDIEITYQTDGNFAIGADAGGYAVADLLARHQDLLRGGVILSGAGDPGAKIGNAKVWIVHAENDNVVPIADAKALAAAWNAKTTFYGWGYIHDCWEDAFKSEAILDWILGI